MSEEPIKKVYRNFKFEENIAQFIFDELNKSVDTVNVQVSKVAVWETENACAAYSK